MVVPNQSWRRAWLARLREKARRSPLARPNMRPIRRVLIAAVGGTVLLIGIALIVLPGPAFLVIPAGLAILGIEFAWARRWLQKTRQIVRERLRPGATRRIRRLFGFPGREPG